MTRPVDAEIRAPTVVVRSVADGSTDSVIVARPLASVVTTWADGVTSLPVVKSTCLPVTPAPSAEVTCTVTVSAVPE